MSACAVGVSGISLPSVTKLAGFAKWPIDGHRSSRPTSSRQVTYGVLPENVIVRLRRVAAPRRQRLAAVGEFEVRGRTRADEVRDEHLLHAFGLLVPGHPRDRRVRRVHGARPRRAVSRRSRAGHGSASTAPRSPSIRRTCRTECVPLVSSVALSALPTATQWKPPLAPSPSLTALAAKTCSLLSSPLPLWAYLVPDDPRHAVVGARERDVGLDAFTRGVDVQARFVADTRDAGLLPAEAADRRHVPVDGHAFRLDAVAVGRAGADRPLDEDLVDSFQARELLERRPMARAWTGRPRSRPRPTGFRPTGWCRCSAREPARCRRRVPRAWPPKIHLPWFASPVLSKRLAKTLLFSKSLPLVVSYQVAHGTVRSLPAKSIEGASPSVAWSKFSEPGNCGAALERPPTVPLPLVVHAPFAKERAKIWSCGGAFPSVSRWRKIAHGTAGLPAASEPPTTSALARAVDADADRRVDAGREVVVDLSARGSGWNANDTAAAHSRATTASAPVNSARLDLVSHGARGTRGGSQHKEPPGSFGGKAARMRSRVQTGGQRRFFQPGAVPRRRRGSTSAASASTSRNWRREEMSSLR